MAVLAAQWGLAALAITLTAIDLEKYNVFSMVCYIGMGWMALLFVPQLTAALTAKGFYWLLAGGIAYTVGAVLYGLGSKKKWLHSVFHIFVVLGSFLQFIAIYFFAII
jgi:hemolysin III